jgi:hypothetical protein
VTGKYPAAKMSMSPDREDLLAMSFHLFLSQSSALWELAQLDRANEAVRRNLLNRWFGTTETDGGQGMPPAVALLAVVDAFMRGGGWWRAGPPGSHGVEMWNTIDLPSAERWN